MKPLTLLVAGLVLSAGSVLAQPAPPPVRASAVGPLDAFFAATSSTERGRVAEEFADSDLSFESILDALRRGPPHTAQVPRGRLEPTLEGADGHLHRYLLLVPETYDPARRYPLHVYLHGATFYPDRGPGGSWWPQIDLVASEDHISVLPLAWDDCLWWQYGQVEALNHIVTDAKRAFNVDDNRVFLLGVSDGGAGVYFSAMHNPTPWAAFIPMIGNPQVLENPNYGVDGPAYAVNLRNRPLFIVNTSDDTTHPPEVISPYLRRYRDAGVRLQYHEYPGGHDLSWWPQAIGPLESFLEEHRRNPYPDQVEWMTDRVDRYNRVHWLVVDEVGPAGRGAEASRLAALENDASAGAVVARRSGNDFRVETQRVLRFRLLLSPDEIDFDAPVRVTVNGRRVFDERIAPDREVLLRWAAADFDRTMLYAAEIVVEVPR